MTPKKFWATALVIGIPVLISRTVGLLMLPIYTRVFSPADLGFLETLLVLLAFFQIFSTLEAGQALARFLPESKTLEDQGKLISATLSIFIVGAFIVLSTTALFAPFIFKLLGIPPLYTSHLPYIAFYLVSAQIFYFFQLQFIYRFQTNKSAVVNVTTTLLIAFSCLTLYLSGALSVKNFLLAQSIGYLIGMLIALALIQMQGVKLIRPSIADFPTLLRYSLPLLFSSTAVVIASSFDKIFISKLISIDELGYYSLATRLAAVAQVAFQVFGNVMAPYLYNPVSRSSAKKALAHMLGVTSTGTLAITALLLMFAADIVLFIAPQNYASSAYYLAPAVLIAVTANLYQFFPNLDIAKRTKTMAAINISACVIGGGIAYATAESMGASGIILGRFAGAFGMSVFYWYYSNERQHPANQRKTLVALATFPLCYLLWWLTSSQF